MKHPSFWQIIRKSHPPSSSAKIPLSSLPFARNNNNNNNSVRDLLQLPAQDRYAARAAGPSTTVTCWGWWTYRTTSTACSAASAATAWCRRASSGIRSCTAGSITTGIIAISIKTRSTEKSLTKMNLAELSSWAENKRFSLGRCKLKMC